MPTKPKRGCATWGCPNLAEGGGVYCLECASKLGLDADSRSYGDKSAEAVANDKWYNSTAWRKLRRSYIERYPLCADCLKRGKITPAKVVDHIVPVLQGGDKFSEDNLQSLCQSCHERKSMAEGSRGFNKKGRKVYTY